MTGHHLEVMPLHELDGECHTERIDPDFTAPTARDVKPGPKVEP